ncbi:hypothetical protein OHR68_09755 [Spirillospora sp. NBC_00431]
MSGITLGDLVDMVVDLLEPHLITLATAEQIMHEASGYSRGVCTHLLAHAYTKRCRAADRTDGSWSQ